MQAVLTSSYENAKENSSQLRYLFDQLEGADNSTKNVIENEIVSFGENAIDFLVNKLTASKGQQRGVAAMSLIRIGENSIPSLRELAQNNKNFNWVANYIIKEIEGTL